MKLKHALVAAGLLAAASSANAAIDFDNADSFGAGTGSGELFVSVFRNVAGQEQSFLIDTGVTASQLLGGTLASGTILGNVGGFFGTAPTSSFVFNAGAVANAGNPGEFGTIFTTNNAAAAQQFAAAQSDTSGVGSINFNLQTFEQSANALLAAPTNYANNDDLSGLIAGSGGYHGRLDWGSALGGAVTFSTEGALDTALALWAVVINEDFSSFSRVALGFLTAESGTGNIMYSASAPSPVPLPAAVWLLGSALVGMAAVGRRRRVDATAAA